jgi:hypothetical protein
MRIRGLVGLRAGVFGVGISENVSCVFPVVSEETTVVKSVFVDVRTIEKFICRSDDSFGRILSD